MKLVVDRERRFFESIKNPFKRFSSSNAIHYLVLFLVFLYSFSFATFENVPSLRALGNIFLISYLVFGTLDIVMMKKIHFSWVPFFFISFAIYIYLFSFIQKQSISLLPFIYCCTAVVTFYFFSSLPDDLVPFFLLAIYLGFFLFSITMLVFYMPDFLKGKFGGTYRYGQEFGNQDKVGSVLGFGIVLGLYYLRKTTIFASFGIFIQTFLLIVTMTRAPYLYLVPALLIFALSFFSKKSDRVLVSLIFASIMISLFVVLSFVSFTRPLILRVVDGFLTIFGNGSDASSIERKYLLTRSYVYGFLHPLFGYGYSGIFKYGSLYEHDGFGDVAIPYGGLAAVFVSFLFMYVIFCFLNTKNAYRNLLASIAFVFLVSFFAGTPFSSRIFYMQFPYFLYLRFGYSAKNVFTIKNDQSKALQDNVVLTI